MPRPDRLETEQDFLTTKEVAEYLRIKERRVYELVRQRAIPCTRVVGVIFRRFVYVHG